MFRRFYRVRPLASALLCLPGLLVCGWYSWKAYESFNSYRESADAKVRLTWEDFHLQLHDVLLTDVRRMLMHERPSPSRLKTFAFHMATGDMGELMRGAEVETQRPYLPAELEWEGKRLEVELHLRGSQHWNVLGQQKSLKVRLPKGDLVEGHRVFNLLNDPMPMVVGEELILDLARDHGVLTPKSSFVRVSINGTDFGVMRFETQPDEGLLRDHRRFPGSIYSGDLPSSAKTEELWTDAKLWKKVAWRDEAEEKDFHEIERLLKLVKESSARDFADFARNEFDLEAWATFDALDVIFGGEQHDFRENHKLYFDPYRGRWEPVAWNFMAFRNDPVFNLVENPFLLRLKQVPEYLSIRNRIVYELLSGKAGTSALRDRGAKMLKKLGPELASDPYWVAYQQLPRIDGFHRRMLRPMTVPRAELVFDSELDTQEKRQAFLMRAIENNPLWIRPGAVEGERVPVDIIIDGQAGVELTGFRIVRAGPDDASARWTVSRDGAVLAGLSNDSELLLAAPIDLHPAMRVVARPDPGRAKGKVLAEPAPAAYRFVLQSAAPILSIEALGRHLATGSRVRSRPATEDIIRNIPASYLDPDAVPGFRPWETGPHPARIARPSPEIVHLGPGVIPVAQTRVFGSQQIVEVAAGTEFLMAPGASFVFLGKVVMAGAKDRPVTFRPAERKPWGGIALQGRATAGSTLDQVRVVGGTRPDWGLIPFPAMLNIHDTRDIAVRNILLEKPEKPFEALHATYVEDLRIEDTEVADAPADAFDLEFVKGSMRNIRVRGAGDDGVDLMGSTIEIHDSVILGCADSAVSAGEETRVEIHGALLAASQVGVLAKNASTVLLSGSLLFRNGIGARVYKREVRFAGVSVVQADSLFVVGCLESTKRDDDSSEAFRVGRIHERLPEDGSLDHLAADVLGLGGWNELDAWLERAKSGGWR